MQRTVIALVFVFLCCQAAALGADALLQAIDLYKAGKYAEAAPLLKQLVVDKPDDAAVRYYLANCQIGLGDLSGADRQYEECLRLKPSPYMEAHSLRMRSDIEKHLRAAQNKSVSRTGLQMSVQEMKRYQRRRFEEQAQSRIADLQRQIERLRLDQKELTFQLPPFFYGRRGQRNNPEFSFLRNQSSSQISKIMGEIMDIRRTLREQVEKSDMQVDSTYAALASQANATTGNIKPFLTSRSIYVRDYVHFNGDEAPPDFTVTPLKATPGKYMQGSAAP